MQASAPPPQQEEILNPLRKNAEPAEKHHNGHERPEPDDNRKETEAGAARDSSSSSSEATRPSKEYSSQRLLPHPPALSFSPWDKKASILVCTLGLLLFDLVLPCIIYYSLAYFTSLNIEVNLGISCASLGLGEMMELPLRGYRLIRYRNLYAPLGQEAKWGFDFLFWWYLVATVIGIVPYVISTCLDEAVLWLFLFTPGFLVGFAVFTAAVSAIPFRLPCRVSSDAKGERCKPFVYYIIEDFVAVDAGQMRVYREELRARWNASPIFRRLLWDVNLWWVIGGVVFIGALAGMTWGLEFNIAYGLSFGFLFLWIGVWALGTWGWARRELRREREWFARRSVGIDGQMEKELDAV